MVVENSSYIRLRHPLRGGDARKLSVAGFGIRTLFLLYSDGSPSYY